MNDQIIEHSVKAVVELSQEEFSSVIASLSALLQELNKVSTLSSQSVRDQNYQPPQYLGPLL